MPVAEDSLSASLCEISSYLGVANLLDIKFDADAEIPQSDAEFAMKCGLLDEGPLRSGDYYSWVVS
jgi:hypothetical protein